MNIAFQKENVAVFLEGEIAPDPERRRTLGHQNSSLNTASRKAGITAGKYQEL
jgi:hypothetical protein